MSIRTLLLSAVLAMRGRAHPAIGPGNWRRISAAGTDCPNFVPKDFSWDTIRTLKEHHDRELERVREGQTESP